MAAFFFADNVIVRPVTRDLISQQPLGVFIKRHVGTGTARDSGRGPRTDTSGGPLAADVLGRHSRQAFGDALQLVRSR
ncbi:hypothetical protein Lesp02_03670 [Lentzea sp. NBRC 105346]|nr:hypothetical protein Lesp02_03670 [Lentzea sp. NBRC 105346]